MQSDLELANPKISGIDSTPISELCYQWANVERMYLNGFLSGASLFSDTTAAFADIEFLIKVLNEKAKL